MTTGRSWARRAHGRKGMPSQTRGSILSITAMRWFLFPVNSVWFPCNGSVTSLSFNGKPPSTVGSSKPGMAVESSQTQGSGSSSRFVRDTVSAVLVKLPVQRHDSLPPRMVWPKLGGCRGRFETQDVNLRLHQLLDFVPDGRGRDCRHKNSPSQKVREFPVASPSRSHDDHRVVGVMIHDSRLWGNRSFRVLQSNTKWRSRNSHSARNLQ
jgi:hypothetical protein